MKYIKQQDYDYIVNKYHDIDKPFDSMRRFIRQDKIFSSDSGMDPEQILSGIRENDKQYETLPHSIRKARAIEYVYIAILHNKHLYCDIDIFPYLLFNSSAFKFSISVIFL